MIKLHQVNGQADKTCMYQNDTIRIFFTRNNCSLLSIVGISRQENSFCLYTLPLHFSPKRSASLSLPISRKTGSKCMVAKTTRKLCCQLIVVAICIVIKTKCGRILGFVVFSSYLPWRFCPFNFSSCPWQRITDTKSSDLERKI